MNVRLALMRKRSALTDWATGSGDDMNGQRVVTHKANICASDAAGRPIAKDAPDEGPA